MNMLRTDCNDLCRITDNTTNVLPRTPNLKRGNAIYERNNAYV